MSAFGDIAARGPIRIWEGILARTIEGEQLSLAVVELDPEASSESTATRTSSSVSSSRDR